jgi:DNA-binding transcriptional LysR family regulator
MNHSRTRPERADPLGHMEDDRQAAPPGFLPGSGCTAPESVELRHLRYFAAVADAGTFTHAAERMFIAQPTLSQQIRRLEELVGAPLLQRRREGVRLTEAGAMLLEVSRRVLSRVDHGMSRTRQAAGLGRPRLRFVLTPSLPEALAVELTSRLRHKAADADIDIAWLETPLDADFSPIRQRQADVGLGWMSAESQALPAPLDVMSLGEFEPVAWVPSPHPAASRGEIGLDELVRMDVVHGPRRVSPGTYDAWLAVLRTKNPHFEFTDPLFRRSLPMTLAFAATASPPAAVLTGPQHRLTAGPALTRPGRPAETSGMVPVRLDRHPLSATAGLAWSGDLPRQLQQVLFDTADGIHS